MQLLVYHSHYEYEVLGKEVVVGQTGACFYDQPYFLFFWVYEYFEQWGQRDVICKMKIFFFSLQEVDVSFLEHYLSFAVSDERLPYFFDSPSGLI